MGLIDTAGNILVMVYLTLFFKNLVFLIFNKEKVKNVQVVNNELNKLRSVPLKTLEEQKRFLDMKFPKTEPFKWKWVYILIGIREMFYFTLFGVCIRYIMLFLNITFNLWSGLLFITIWGIGTEIVMRKFNIENTDLTYILGWRKKVK